MVRNVRDKIGPLVLIAILVSGLALLSYMREAPVPVGPITTPVFQSMSFVGVSEALAWLGRDVTTHGGDLWPRDVLPNKGGALWLSLVVTLLVGLSHGRASGRFVDLLLLQAVGWILFGTLDLLANERAPEAMSYMRLAFAGASLVTTVLWVRTFLWQQPSVAPPWQPALPRHVLKAGAIALAVMNLTVVFVELPDDSSFFANLGAQRMRETGRLPYGDSLLTNTAGAAYGPVMYGVHALVQRAVAAPVPAPIDPAAPRAIADDPRPPDVVPRLVLACAHLTTLVLLFLLGRQLVDETAAWGLLVLYTSAPWLVDMASTRASVAGLTYVSHIVPPAASLAAFAALDWPVMSGMLLAVAAGLGFYPAFFFPVWAGAQWGRSQSAALWFTAVFGAVCSLILAWVLLASQAAPGLALVGTIVRDTLGHHSDPAGYGRSLFGLWGQQTGVMAWLSRPLVGTSTMASPFFLLYIASLLLAAHLARRADRPRVALLTAGAAIGANLWKIHSTVSYVAWDAPFLFLGVLALGTRSPSDSPEAQTV